MIIAIDFDGTCVTHDYPQVGKDIGAIPVLKKMVQAGHTLILLTMRSGKELTDAVEWFKNNDIPLYSVNSNPTQHTWTESPKVYAHLYIDDCGLGIPLNYIPMLSKRNFVDWERVEEMLKQNDII